MKKTNRQFALLSLFFLSMFIIVPTVSAHPLGNFTINHFARLHIAPRQIRVDTVLDMAEIPAFQEISLLDTNQNGKADPAELAGYPERQCQAILTKLALRRAGRPVPLSLDHSVVSFPPGAGGLSTLRLVCAFQSQTLPLNQNDRIDFQDNSYADRIGWREIVINPEGVPVFGQFATTSISKELTAYPQDLLASPLDERQVSLQIGSSAAPQNAPTGQNSLQKKSGISFAGRSDRFTELITLPTLTPAAVLLALLIAFVWGGLHALTPGHGKTIVGAYLVGSRGTARHAIFLGLMTTMTHTAGVFLLGLVTYLASRYIVPEQLFPWISIASGILVMIIGISLFAGRLRATQAWAALVQRVSEWNAHFFARFTGTGLSGQGMESPREHGRKPLMPQKVSPVLPALQGITVTGQSGLSQPSRISTITLQSHGHPHPHGAAVQMIPPHTHADGTVHMHGLHSHPHSHGFGVHTHSHLPPGTDGGKVTLRSLFMLGISGGLLPCPSALVVLLGAIALHRIGFGIVLVLVFSIGLAGVLTAIGLLLVYARRFFERVPVRSRFTELIPAGSALFITILGTGITLQALAQLK